jgi:hypothetical protein
VISGKENYRQNPTICVSLYRQKSGQKMKSQKINRPLNAFPIDLLLISIDNRQRVTCKYFKINMLKIEKK